MKFDDRHQHIRTPSPRSTPSGKLCRKIALLVTEDWFALSHFRSLIVVLTQIAQSVIVVTHSSGRVQEIEALGARVVEFNFRRESNHPVLAARLAWALSKILQRERPEVVHLVAMKPIVLAGLALTIVTVPHIVVHVTGQGLAGISTIPKLRIYRMAMRRIMAFLVRKPSSYVLVENPDDIEMVREVVSSLGSRFAILGGAGVDPDAFPRLIPPDNHVPVAAYVGRMIKSKGVDLLMQAFDRLVADGVQLKLELYGSSDKANPEAISPDEITTWCNRVGARWCGQVTDVVEVWRQADVFILPSRGGEGLPRALLEAASCARPLIVSDVPGNRHFVRDGVEGLVVPRENVTSIAVALQKLAADSELRLQMGEAARQRLLSGYTESHFKGAVLESYKTLLRRRSSTSHQ